MAQTKPKADTVETLSDEVDALRADLGKLIETMKDVGLTDAKEASDKAAEVKDVITDHVADAGQLLSGAAQDVAGTAQGFVKENPIIAILAAAAAGLAVGLATAKR